MKNENSNNSIVAFIGILLISLLSAIAISFGDFSSSTKNLSKNRSLKDNYYKQEKIKQEELRKCQWFTDNSQVHSTRLGSSRYYFDWKNNTVLVFNGINSYFPCKIEGKYILGKIYNEDGIKKQYIVEYSGKRGTLVKYTQRRDGETTRKEACDCIIRSTPY